MYCSLAVYYRYIHCISFVANSTFETVVYYVYFQLSSVSLTKIPQMWLQMHHSMGKRSLNIFRVRAKIYILESYGHVEYILFFLGGNVVLHIIILPTRAVTLSVRDILNHWLCFFLQPKQS